MRFLGASLLALFVLGFALASGNASPPCWSNSPNKPPSCGTTSSTTTTSTTTTTTPSGYPASFSSGPAGANNLLPPNGSYPARGAWLGDTPGSGVSLASREQYFGRRFNIEQMWAQNRCDPYPSILASIVSAGYIPMVTFYPTPNTADQIIAGAADNCIRSFGTAIGNQPARVLVRLYHEFNGGWMPFSKNSDGTRATAAQELQMWRHTVDVLRTTSFSSRASIVWNVHEGYYNNGDAWNNPTPYPGDSYVDWVSSDGYNHDKTGAWCGAYPYWSPTINGYEDWWCNFGTTFTHGRYAPKYTPVGVEADFRGRKPYMVAETGSVEDTPGRKGQWMIDMGTYAKMYMPGLYAIVYFDAFYDNTAWNLDSSSSSMDGFKSFATDPFFDIPN